MTTSHPGDLPSESYLAAIIESSDDAILSKDREAIVRTWNPAAERLYGWTADEAVGRPISIIIPRHLAGEEYRILDRILAGERVDHYETERLRRDGTLVWVSLTISPVRDESGTVVAASVISRDVTERRRLEQERVRLLAEARAANVAAERSRGRLAFLARASEVLSRSLDMEKCLQRVAELVAAGLAERCAILLLENEELRPVARAQRTPPLGAIPADLPTSALLNGALSHTRAHSGVPQGQVWEGEGIDPEVRVDALATPIFGHAGPLGTIALVAPAAGQGYGREDVSLVEELAGRTALAIENARAFRAEHDVAVRLQRSLLPRQLGRIPGISFAFRYLPARPLNVGGDWYDVVPTPEGTVVGAIGDVAGRGLEAAAIMAQLRNAVRAYAFEGRSPAECAERVNLLMRSFTRGDMATLAILSLDPGTHELRLVTAGHPPPFVRANGGSVSRIDALPCLPLGVSAQAEYRESVHELPPGSMLVLYTDGLIERRREPIDEGLARLERVVAEGPENIEELADFLAERMLGEEAERADDVALLLLRVVS